MLDSPGDFRREKIEGIADQRPDLILLDIMMPKVDGYEVCKYIKNQDPSVKVIFLSAKSKEQDIQKGLAIGADLYLTKPFVNKDLVAKVKAILN